MKVAVITDSTAYLSKDIRDEYGIHMVPLTVTFDDQSFQEELDLGADQFYQLVKASKDLPKTSQPAIGHMVDLLETLAEDHDAVIAVHLSSGISGTFQSMQTAGSMVEGIDVYTFDSEISCMPQGFYAVEAAKLAESGTAPEAILARLNEMKETMRAYFLVDDLVHLHRGGRLNGAQALVGSVLQVKPILHFVDTKIVPFEKIRTQKKAIKRLLDLIDEDAKDGTPLRASVIHANCPMLAETLIRELKERYTNVEITMSYFGAVIGTHLGEGSLGLGWYKK
ncbi:DegV family protein with EDD domain [Streptohalobacillus salinus]|uniref:DegV family protein with EDD domain n=1 Tax=Streptohalobacillus salinus TaxID=621096 RepID=A0A2V3WFF4_9BACI|nr:DegV family protein [Streptohalobacillus salinus]PXW93005.1 DegV family protein with EDD domain [Streptohalobacillus salinus]